jgi:hypothetical protein
MLFSYRFKTPMLTPISTNPIENGIIIRKTTITHAGKLAVSGIFHPVPLHDSQGFNSFGGKRVGANGSLSRSKFA